MEEERAAAGAYPLSAGEVQKIREQLGRLVAHSLFRNSKRYPALLRFVVEQTLLGQDDQLKERVLGVTIFGRPADYDTGQDTIVRLTAAEVRKRLALYYQESGHETEPRIQLHPGSYVPEFEFPDHAADTHPAPVASTPLESASASLPAEIFVPIAPQPPAASPRGGRWLAAAVIVVLLVAVGGLWRVSHPTDRALRQLWDPFLGDSPSVLMVIPDLNHNGVTPEPAATDGTSLSHLERDRSVYFDDAVVAMRLTSLLTRRDRTFSLMLASEVPYSAMQSTPTIFIGAVDNPWTLRVLAPLRFHPARQGTSWVFSITDTQHPERRDWSLDFEQPYQKVSTDYAIVARISDGLTGRPMLVVAGLGANGTAAATEFLVSPRYARELDPALLAGSRAKSFELVLKTQVIDDQPGPPQIVAETAW
ncbi:hypothetical protein [Silvibacterium sp.]|uniref:hypothetical protein n=1 Tax=Silvibacterium sp. TaxID=1964179 RepID=UPI0039E4FFE8